MTEISVESVCEFITSHGGKVKNITLVSNFKKLLNDPATRDAARQQFKECVNTVAVVKTENGEKYVQLKKKYRSPSSSSRSSVASDANVPPPEVAKQPAAPAPEVVKAKDAEVAKQHSSEVARQQKTPEAAWKSGSKPQHNPESPEKGDLNNSYNPTQDVPFADGSPQKAHDSPRHKHHKSNRSTPEHHKSTGSIPREGSTSSRKSRDEKSSADSHHGSPRKEKHKHKEEGKVEKPVDVTKHESGDTLDSNVKPSAVPVAPPGDSEFAVPNAPRRKKKERKENVPPSPSLEHRAPNSIERVKAALQNSGEQGRISRARPASVMQTSYTGSVERARQNFQSKPKNGEDTTSVSEKSMDSRGENEQDDEYDRYAVSVSLSVNEKAWMLKSCQGDMVGMRKLLDNDPTLLEKKDFISVSKHLVTYVVTNRTPMFIATLVASLPIYTCFILQTALHWAAKKGNKDMLHMLLDLKVEVNVKSNGGYTPLHLAAMNGHEDVIISLLQHDANPKMRDFSGRLPIHYLKLDMSLPLQSKPPLSTPQHVSKHGVVSSRAVLSAGGVARWKRHIFAGTGHGHTVSHATQHMLSQKEIAWKEPDRGEEADCLEPMPSAPISTERKESTGNGAHKGTKLSRKNSVLTSFGMGKRKTSMRKPKNGHDKNDHNKNGHDNGNSGEVVPLPTNKAYINHTKMWKPAGPKN
ncbi:uncharacterized protein LOC100183514 [Ciona intestinalis]